MACAEFKKVVTRPAPLDEVVGWDTAAKGDGVDSRGRAIVDDLLLLGKDISYMSDLYSK